MSLGILASEVNYLHGSVFCSGCSLVCLFCLIFTPHVKELKSMDCTAFKTIGFDDPSILTLAGWPLIIVPPSVTYSSLVTVGLCSYIG